MEIVGFLKVIGVKLRAFALALGGPGLFLIAVADSSFITIPEANDILIVVLSIGQHWYTMLCYVMMTTLGSVLGCCLLYSAGRKGGEVMLRKRFSQARIDWVRGMFARSDILMILIPCLLPPPMPFKIFVLSSGVFGLKPSRFIFAVFMGRTLRYSMWGVLAVLYGEVIRDFIQHDIHKVGIILMVLFFALAMGLVVRYLQQQRKAKSGTAAPSNRREYLIGGKN